MRRYSAFDSYSGPDFGASFEISDELKALGGLTVGEFLTRPIPADDYVRRSIFNRLGHLFPILAEVNAFIEGGEHGLTEDQIERFKDSASESLLRSINRHSESLGSLDTELPRVSVRDYVELAIHVGDWTELPSKMGSTARVQQSLYCSATKDCEQLSTLMLESVLQRMQGNEFEWFSEKPVGEMSFALARHPHLFIGFWALEMYFAPGVSLKSFVTKPEGFEGDAWVAWAGMSLSRYVAMRNKQKTSYAGFIDEAILDGIKRAALRYASEFDFDEALRYFNLGVSDFDDMVSLRDSGMNHDFMSSVKLHS